MPETWDIGSIRLHLVSWPDGVPHQAGLEVADWHLVTRRPVQAEDLERCLHGLGARPQSQMAFEGIASGTDLWLRSTYSRDLPMPARIGAAGAAWLAIDNEVGRLWTINGEPKTFWYPFKMQRRAALDGLTPLARKQWLAMVLQRSEPLFAAVANVPSTVEDWSSSAGPDEMRRRWAELSEIVRRSGVATALRTTTGPLGLDDLASLFVQAAGEATEASLDALASAAEKIFEGRWVLDATYSTDFLAKVEDEESFDDAQQLGSDLGSARALFARSLDRAREAEAFAVERKVSDDVQAVRGGPAQ